jgi:hypothetical protein
MVLSVNSKIYYSLLIVLTDQKQTISSPPRSTRADGDFIGWFLLIGLLLSVPSGKKKWICYDR